MTKFTGALGTKLAEFTDELETEQVGHEKQGGCVEELISLPQEHLLYAFRIY